jgi:hypothetical protein
MIKICDEFNVVSLGGEYALLPKLDRNSVQSGKKGLVINESAYEIYKLICEQEDEKKVVDKMCDMYSNDQDYIKKIVHKCVESFTKAGIIMLHDSN